MFFIRDFPPLSYFKLLATGKQEGRKKANRAKVCRVSFSRKSPLTESISLFASCQRYFGKIMENLMKGASLRLMVALVFSSRGSLVQRCQTRWSLEPVGMDGAEGFASCFSLLEIDVLRANVTTDLQAPDLETPEKWRKNWERKHEQRCHRVYRGSNEAIMNPKALNDPGEALVSSRALLQQARRDPLLI